MIWRIPANSRRFPLYHVPFGVLEASLSCFSVHPKYMLKSFLSVMLSDSRIWRSFGREQTWFAEVENIRYKVYYRKKRKRCQFCNTALSRRQRATSQIHLVWRPKINLPAQTAKASCHSLRATVCCPGVGISAMAAQRLTWTSHTSQCINSARSCHMATHSSSTCLALCCTGRLSSSVLTWYDWSEPRLCELFDVVRISLQLCHRWKRLLDKTTGSQGLITLLALQVYWLLVCRRWPQVKSMTSPEASHFLALGCRRVMG